LDSCALSFFSSSSSSSSSSCVGDCVSSNCSVV
jgi:hypothetical protein